MECKNKCIDGSSCQEIDTEIINFLIALTDMQMKLYLKEYEPNNLYQRTLRTLYDMLPDEKKKKVPESIRATITEKGLKEWLNRGKAQTKESEENMVYEDKKFEETPEELIARKKEEIYKRACSIEMCEKELKIQEDVINRYLKEQNRPGTATDIVNEVKEIFEKYDIKFTGIAATVLVYLFELLEL